MQTKWHEMEIAGKEFAKQTRFVRDAWVAALGLTSGKMRVVTSS